MNHDGVSPRLAFAISPELARSLQQLQDGAAQGRALSATELTEMADRFMTEVLAAFFEGPIREVGVEGAAASIVRGGVAVINKAGRALVRSLVSKAGTTEQQALARHFQSLTFERDGHSWIGLRLSPELFDSMQSVFQGYLSGASGFSRPLVEVMGRLCDLGVGQLFDDIMGSLKLGMLQRGLVATARATIHRSAMLAVEKALPSLGREHKTPVVAYFLRMLQRD